MGSMPQGDARGAARSLCYYKTGVGPEAFMSIKSYLSYRESLASTENLGLDRTTKRRAKGILNVNFIKRIKFLA